MYPRLFYPLLAYRSFFSPFLALCALVIPCWLIFRFYRHWNSGHGLSIRRELLLLAFIVYLSGVAAATLSPNHGSLALAAAGENFYLRPNLVALTCSSESLPKGSTVYSFCVRNARGNVLLFLPLGILLPLIWRQVRFWRGVSIALAASGGIELLQFLSSRWGGYRAADVNDIILNVLGSALGLAGVGLVRLAARVRQSPGTG